KDVGSKPIKELLQPAIQTAVEGFPINNYLANRFEKRASTMNVREMRDYFPEAHLLEAHDELVQPELAQNLKLIQENRSNAFYKHESANDIVEHIDDIEHSDLANYDIEITEQVHGGFAGYDIYSAPPPLAGVTLIQMLQMAEASQIDSMDNIV